MATTMGAMLPAYSHPSRPPHGNHNHSSDDISMESQPRSTTKELNTSSALPKPLHIAKYDFKERQEQNGDDSSTPRAQARRSVNSRTVSPLSSRSSARSVLTNVSMESLPEPMGGQRPLTVPKRRDNNSSRTSQARGDAACGVGLSNCAEDRHEKGVADIMTSLGRMTLSEEKPGRVPGTEAKTVSAVGMRFNQPATLFKSAQSRVSHIPRSQPMLSDKPSLMRMDRRYQDSKSESTSSHYSYRNNDLTAKSYKPPRNSSPSPSFRSIHGVSTPVSEACEPKLNARSSPWLRSTRSMHHMSTAAQPFYGYDGGVSLSPPLSAVAPGLGLDTGCLGDGGRGGGSRKYSADSYQSSFDDPYILVPRIVVTPESKTLEDGATTLWAAVQISTQIRPGNASAYQKEDNQTIPGPSQLDIFRYGCLYDVSVEVLPTESSVIVELLNDKTYTNSTLYPGSRLLVIAHVRLLSTPSLFSSGAAPSLRRGTHAKQSSDDLIQDLEHHLGNTLTEYLQIRLKYHHSCFPHQKQDQSASPDGITNMETSLQTTARAAIKQHNSSSLWSPRPALQSNPLFEIIASHWGPESAGDVMQRIISSHSTTNYAVERRRTPAQEKGPPLIPLALVPRDYRVSNMPGVREGSEDTLKPAMAPMPTRIQPPIPKRQASLHCPQPKTTSTEKLRSQEHQAPDLPSNKKTVWTQLRRTSLTERAKSKTGAEQKSFVKSSVKRVPSISLPVSSSLANIRPPSAPEFSFALPGEPDVTGTQAGVASGSVYPPQGSHSVYQGIMKQSHSTIAPRDKSKDKSRDYFTANTINGRVIGPPASEWTGNGTTAKRVGNEIIDEERAKRRQRILLEQSTTSLPRGVALDNYGSRRYRQPPGDVYQPEERTGGGQKGGGHQRHDGSYGGSKTKKDRESGTVGTASGRWGWTGWWP